MHRRLDVRVSRASGDTSDWLDARGTAEKLIQLIEQIHDVRLGNTTDSGNGEDDDGSSWLTEMIFAERLIDRHGDDVRFTLQRGRLTWTGTHWQPDELAQIEKLTKETVRDAYAVLGTIDNPQLRQKNGPTIIERRGGEPIMQASRQEIIPPPFTSRKMGHACRLSSGFIWFVLGTVWGRLGHALPGGWRDAQ